MSPIIRKTALLAAITLAFAGLFQKSAHAVDGVSFAVGRGNDGADIWRAGAQWKWERRWFRERSWHIRGYWEASLGHWDNEGRAVTDAGLTPVFRLEKSSPGQWSPFVEAAIGFHYLSRNRVTGRRTFSTRFQFGDHVAIGTRFGGRYQYDVSLQLQHLSNASIKTPNPGINFALLRMQYHF
jgi:hypothetical protein